MDQKTSMTLEEHIVKPNRAIIFWLGLITLVTLVCFALGSLFMINKALDKSDITQCYVEQLGKPWLGLKESFQSPPGDTAARDRALKQITRGIDAIAQAGGTCK